MTIEESVIYLVSCAVNEEIPEAKYVTEMEPAEVLRFARRHKIGCCAALALESAGVINEGTIKTISTAMRRNALFANSLEEVTGRFDAAGIWHIPLKGILLKEYYPKPFMREMADLDILIDPSQAAEVREIMESLGFTTDVYGIKNHDVYFKKPIFNYEMHTSLFSSRIDSKIYTYFRGCRDLSRPEDFYLYIVAHEYKHYTSKGTGLRSLLDVCMYLKKESLDWDYVEKEAEKIGISAFERSNRELAEAVFGKCSVTDEKMLKYVLSSGAYGTYAQKVENSILKNNGSRIRYILERFSVPLRTSDPSYQFFARKYPVYYKYKILLPFLPIRRIFLGLKNGRFATEMKVIFKLRSVK